MPVWLQICVGVAAMGAAIVAVSEYVTRRLDSRIKVVVLGEMVAPQIEAIVESTVRRHTHPIHERIDEHMREEAKAYKEVADALGGLDTKAERIAIALGHLAKQTDVDVPKGLIDDLLGG